MRPLSLHAGLSRLPGRRWPRRGGSEPGASALRQLRRLPQQFSHELTTVTFPSGRKSPIREMQLAAWSAIRTCLHQRQQPSLKRVWMKTPTRSADRDINIHYYATAATCMAQARGGYQYDGQSIRCQSARPQYDTCSNATTSHFKSGWRCSPVRIESVEDLRFIRMNGTQVDYDGDDDMQEGIAEIETLQEMLLKPCRAMPARFRDADCLQRSAYPTSS
jgi:hypothetical protein